MANASNKPPYTTVKYCFWPNCGNSNHKCREKKFIIVPMKPSRREKWLDFAGITKKYSTKTALFCCEDHFEVIILLAIYPRRCRNISTTLSDTLFLQSLMSHFV
jgi:THAP domain